jgi:poly(3-hydroxybutyrate) depolymerase
VTGVTPRLLLAASIALAACACGAADRLPALGADGGAITVSGVSSGAFMAVQLHVAHSRTVRGAGAIAGGPYDCAQGSLWIALTSCMDPGPWSPLPQPQRLADIARGLAKAGAIDPVERLAGAKVWLFSGTRDETVRPQVVESLRRFYLALAPDADVALENSVPAGHGMVTETEGNACATTGPPFIVDCDYDAAGILLAHLLGKLDPPTPKQDGKLIAFDQGEFAGGEPAAIGMGATGYVFVPNACAKERCRIHVAFHGCRQSAGEIERRFVLEAGYNRWAAANRLIVLYPQTIPRYGFGFGARNFVFNPKACWDWWGYTGSAYHTRDGAQIRAVRAMLDRLGSPR